MAHKITLYVRPGSEEDIREALEDILSSGLITAITDERGETAELLVDAAQEKRPAAVTEKAPSGLITAITDERGETAELLVDTAAAQEKRPEAAPQKAPSPPEKVTVKELAQKRTAENGIEKRTILLQAQRGEETCMGQRISLTDQGGGSEELARQRLNVLFDLPQPRVCLMELKHGAVIDGSAADWFPLGQ